MQRTTYHFNFDRVSPEIDIWRTSTQLQHQQPTDASQGFQTTNLTCRYSATPRSCSEHHSRFQSDSPDLKCYTSSLSDCLPPLLGCLLIGLCFVISNSASSSEKDKGIFATAITLHSFSWYNTNTLIFCYLNWCDSLINAWAYMVLGPKHCTRTHLQYLIWFWAYVVLVSERDPRTHLQYLIFILDINELIWTLQTHSSRYILWTHILNIYNIIICRFRKRLLVFQSAILFCRLSYVTIYLYLI